MDGGILVVSAPDGPMPQTKEHILLARQVSNSCVLACFLICCTSLACCLCISDHMNISSVIFRLVCHHLFVS